MSTSSEKDAELLAVRQEGAKAYVEGQSPTEAEMYSSELSEAADLAGIRAVAAAAWAEGRRAAYEEFERDPRGLYYFAKNPYANALILGGDNAQA